ncbi:MAG: hypothetical protein J6A73_02400 [Lachnospiraceae bacterium]|nr:hypothetical protein [Lachnospiraceae bacterium]
MAVLALLISRITEFICTAVSFVIFQFITALPYFYIARNAGKRSPGLVFLPFVKEYVAFTIPTEKYNIGIIRLTNRKVAFWIYLIPEIIYLLLARLVISRSFYVLSGTIDLANLEDLPYVPQYIFELLFSEPIWGIIAIFFLAMLFILWVIRSVFVWRKNYDLIRCYDVEKHAMWVSIANIFCPLVMFVFSYVLMNRIPCGAGEDDE